MFDEELLLKALYIYEDDKCYQPAQVANVEKRTYLLQTYNRLCTAPAS